jgi:hypothetical protein
MKLKLATAAVLMALASRVALAASEGGDTWSELQPSPSVATERLASDQPHVVATTANLKAASEGGDTWSELQPSLSGATERVASDEPMVVATTANLSTLRNEQANAALGTPVEEASSDRIIKLGPHSHWVNVLYGESVQFVVQGDNGQERSFAWKFDVSPEVTKVDLSKVAPAQFVDHDVEVFVSPDPLYSGD